jgi:hypothetical protein
MFHAVNLQANKATVNLYSRYLDLRPIGLLFIITLVMQNLNYCPAITSVESLRNAIAIYKSCLNSLIVKPASLTIPAIV